MVVLGLRLLPDLQVHHTFTKIHHTALSFLRINLCAVAILLVRQKDGSVKLNQRTYSTSIWYLYSTYTMSDYPTGTAVSDWGVAQGGEDESRLVLNAPYASPDQLHQGQHGHHQAHSAAMHHSHPSVDTSCQQDSPNDDDYCQSSLNALPPAPSHPVPIRMQQRTVRRQSDRSERASSVPSHRNGLSSNVSSILGKFGNPFTNDMQQQQRQHLLCPLLSFSFGPASLSDSTATDPRVPLAEGHTHG